MDRYHSFINIIAVLSSFSIINNVIAEQVTNSRITLLDKKAVTETKLSYALLDVNIINHKPVTTVSDKLIGLNATAVGGNASVINNVTGTISLSGNHLIGILANGSTGNIISLADITITGSNTIGIRLIAKDASATVDQTIMASGNITLTDTSMIPSIGKAIQLDNYTRGKGIITYDDANGTISINNHNAESQSNSTITAGILHNSYTGGGIRVDVKNINQLNINSHNAAGIAVFSTIGDAVVNFLSGTMNIAGDNADGIISVIGVGNNTINQVGDINIFAGTSEFGPTEGIIASSDDGDVIVNSSGNIDINSNIAAGIKINADNGNASVIVNNANKHMNIQYQDQFTHTSSENTAISASAAGSGKIATINIANADYINTSGYGAIGSGLLAAASNGASTHIIIDNVKYIKSASINSEVGAVTSVVTGTGSSLVNLTNNAGLIQADGKGYGIISNTEFGNNQVILGSSNTNNINIVGGLDGSGIYMKSTAGIQHLVSYANISAASDNAIYSVSNAATTVDNYSVVNGYVTFEGDQDVTFNNRADGQLVLKNFSGTSTKSVMTNIFGTNGTFNNDGTIRFSRENGDGTQTTAIFSNVANFNHAGIIDLTVIGKNAATYIGNILKITNSDVGNFISNGGSLIVNVQFNGTTGISDKLVVDNVTTGVNGATKIYINPTANPVYRQLTDGIEIVDVQGTSSADAFVLGRPVVSGIYEYQLGLGTDNNWSLSSYLGTGNGSSNSNGNNNVILYNPAIGAYLANQTTAVQMFQQTLFDRLISSSNMHNNAFNHLFWLSSNIAHSRYNHVNYNLLNRSHSYTLQLGGDLNTWALSNDSYFHLGVMGGYGDAKNTSKSALTGTKTEGNVKGYSLGVYGTYFINQDTQLGLYVDLWSQLGWYRNEISGQAQLDTKKYNSRVWSNSVELGYGIAFANMGDYQWLATPQLQLTYNDYDANDQQDANNLYISARDANGLDSRLGIRLHARGINVNLVEPFLEVNWLDTTAKNKLSFNNQSFEDGFAKRRFEGKIGLQGNITNNWHVSAQIGGQWGEHRFNRYQGQLNVNYQF